MNGLLVAWVGAGAEGKERAQAQYPGIWTQAAVT